MDDGPPIHLFQNVIDEASLLEPRNQGSWIPGDARKQGVPGLQSPYGREHALERLGRREIRELENLGGLGRLSLDDPRSILDRAHARSIAPSFENRQQAL